MNRRSLFPALFGAAVAVPVVAKEALAAKPEPRKRRFINGKRICDCADPEFDMPEPAVTPNDGSHSHTLSSVPGGSCDHTHTLSVVLPTTALFVHGPAKFWRADGTWASPVLEDDAPHCIYCGGIPGTIPGKIA